MGWEKRGDREFYYKAVRVEGKVRKIYCGSGASGRYHEILDRVAVRKLAPVRAEQARHRHLIRESDRLWTEIWSWLWPLSEAHMLLAGYYRHRNTWRKAKRRPRTRQRQAGTEGESRSMDLRAELKRLNQRANGMEPGAKEDLQSFCDSHPEIATQVEEWIRASFALWSGAFSEAMEDRGSDLPELSPLECWLTHAVRIAELNLQHAESLIEPTTVTAWVLSTCYMRIERAENRLRDARRLLSRVQNAIVSLWIPAESQSPQMRAVEPSAIAV